MHKCPVEDDALNSLMPTMSLRQSKALSTLHNQEENKAKPGRNAKHAIQCKRHNHYEWQANQMITDLRKSIGVLYEIPGQGK